MERQDKALTVAKLADMGRRAQLLILVGYRGLKVNELNQVRRELEKTGGNDFLVAKNTLTKRALKDTGFEQIFDQLEGPNALLFAYDDPVAPTKALTELAKKFPLLEVRSGILTGKLLDAEQVRNLAKMPGRIELLGTLAGVLAAPMRNLASGLAAIPRGLVNALTAVKDQKEKQAA